MYPSNGLRNALNKMREMSVENGSVYHQYVPVVTDSTTIGEFGQPIIDSANVNVLNDFVGLLRKVVFTAVQNKTFNNPLAELEGERMPLGQFIEDAYVNPAEARGFNVNDFAGLLQKYEAQVAVQYLGVNSDLQYCVTITREKIRNAFTSWTNLEELVSGMINSLYNGAYITRYNQTKGLVLSAYTANNVKVETVSNPTDASTAKALIQKMRATFSKMKVPSTKYNAWHQVKGTGSLSLKTWSDPQEIVVLISADVEALADVEVLASAFNMDKADFLGHVIVVDDFSQYNERGEVVVDGSAIKAIIADKAFFKIKTQDFSMDEFYNANNRCWNYYLNDVRMVNYSLFANAVVFATAMPSVDTEEVEFKVDEITIEQGESGELDLTVTPAQATSSISYAITTSETGADPDDITIIKSDNDRHVKLVVDASAVKGDYTLTATSNSQSDTATITVA